MLHSVTSSHRHIAHENLHAKWPARTNANFVFFIVTAIIVASIVTTVIRANRINQVSALFPQVELVAQEAPVTITPHGDICETGIDGYSLNIKGYSESGRTGNDCMARQINSGAELGN